MINYYQPFLSPFLKQEKNSWPSRLGWKYFYSFEDGLWELARTVFPNKKSIHFLVPDFYCSDVLDNIRLHGHTYTYYRIDKDFQITNSQIATYISQFRPDVVIVFHCAGIYSKVLDFVTGLKDVVVIEDCVHRLVDPVKLKGDFNNRIVMDSLRKVSPIPGSRMIGSKKMLGKFVNTGQPVTAYLILSSIYYYAFRQVLKLGFCVNSAYIINFAHKMILKRHDDLVGTASNHI